jgi:hypothetical protein
MITVVVVVIALSAGAALGMGASALYVARGNAVGWLVVQHREPVYAALPPSRLIGAENLAGSGQSRVCREADAAGALDGPGAAWTITARPGTGHPQITAGGDQR